jgi:hypothetical protein
MQTIYVNDNKIEFTCRAVLFGRKDVDEDFLGFVIIHKNGKLIKGKELAGYEKEKVEEHIEKLITKGTL